MPLRFGVVVADPAWRFRDELKMDATARGAEVNYDGTLSDDEIIGLGRYIRPLLAPDAVLVLWCPDSKTEVGEACFHAWGFRHTQNWHWVKTKLGVDPQAVLTGVAEDPLAFGMGRLARNCSETAMVGPRGRVYGHLASRSERNVVLHPALPHSQKPEGVQDALDRMFPTLSKLELFARRRRRGWLCLGNQCPGVEGVDLRVALERLRAFD